MYFNPRTSICRADAFYVIDHSFIVLTNSRSVLGERQVMGTVDQSTAIYVCLLCKEPFEVSPLANSFTSFLRRQLWEWQWLICEWIMFWFCLGFKHDRIPALEVRFLWPIVDSGWLLSAVILWTISVSIRIKVLSCLWSLTVLENNFVLAKLCLGSLLIFFPLLPFFVFKSCFLYLAI